MIELISIVVIVLSIFSIIVALIIWYSGVNLLDDKIHSLENEIKILRDKTSYIGAAYTPTLEWDNSVDMSHRYWIKFGLEDISDVVEDSFKIKGVWINKSDIVMYDSIYKEKMNKIEQKYKKGEK